MRLMNDLRKLSRAIEDVAPRTITGKAHRPSYGSDGDYFSKPNVEEIVSAVIEMLRE